MNEGGTTLRRPFRDVVFFFFVEGRKSYALYDWRITLQRDILFAQMVRKEAQKLGYPSLMTDGSRSEKETAEKIARLLKLPNTNKIDIKGENYD